MGDMFSQADCLGHTMIVAPTEYIDHIPTVNTKPGEKSPAIRVNLVDFVDPDNPVVYRGVLWFGVMAGSLRRSISEFLAARMGQGTASPGRNAPWQLIDVTGETDWMNHMNNWLDNTPAGQEFQVEAIQEVNRAAAAAQVAGVQAGTASPAPSPAPAPAVAAPTPVSAPRPAAPAPAPVAAAPAAAAPAPAPAAPAPGAGDLASQLSGLPADELQKVMAAIAAQNQAAH
jgi:hypothetical protein